MRFNTYGNIENPHIMLIHGAGMGWWNFVNYIEELSKLYYVILPTLDGHSEESDTKYISTEYCTKQIINYIEENSCKKLLLLYGLSLGGQVVLEILSTKDNITHFAVVDGSICFPQPFLAKYSIAAIRLFYKLMFSRTSCKIQMFLLGLSRKRSFTNIQKQLYIKYLPTVKKETLYSIYKTYMMSYTLKSTIKNTTAKIIYMYGSKEMKCVKQSALMVKNFVSTTSIIEHKGLNHGELALYYPDKFLSTIYSLIREI